MSNKMRYAIVMIIGVLMNQLFYELAAIFHLPVWLDVCGTAFVAFALEPTAGLLVGLFNNFYLALFAYDSSTLIYYSISAAVALIAGLYLKEKGVFQKKRVLPAILLVAVVSTVLSTIFALIRSGGIPDVGWEYTAYQYALALGLPQMAATVGALFVIKLLDTLASALIVAVMYKILPKKLKFSAEKL